MAESENNFQVPACSSCGKAILFQASAVPGLPECDPLESAKAESKVGTFNCQEQITLALWEDEEQLLIMQGS